MISVSEWDCKMKQLNIHPGELSRRIKVQIQVQSVADILFIFNCSPLGLHNSHTINSNHRFHYESDSYHADNAYVCTHT